MIYLDNAATSFPKPASVINAVLTAMRDYGANPGRSGHALSKKAGETVYAAREKAAYLFGVAPEEVVFTKNATEALNIAISGSAKKGDIIISDLEHNSVRRTALALKSKGVNTVFFDTSGSDSDIIRRFSASLSPKVKTAALTHASNVTGRILPIYELSKIAKKKGITVIIDASQTAGVLPVPTEYADFICMAGHKSLFGPMGTGILLAKGEASPLIFGGTGTDSQDDKMPSFTPERFEGGTLNMPGIAGVAAGLSFIGNYGENNILTHERELLSQCFDGLDGFPGVKILSEKPTSSVGIFTFNIDGVSSGEAAEMLDGLGICVRSGLHCAPTAHKRLGTEKTGAVRASFGVFNSASDVSEFIRAIKAIARQ